MYHRRSNSMPFVFLDIDDWNPDAFSKLSDEPLKLSVLKLDGTSFDIAVTKSATVADLKEAVEHVFSFVPRKGPGKISWCDHESCEEGDGIWTVRKEYTKSF